MKSSAVVHVTIRSPNNARLTRDTTSDYPQKLHLILPIPQTQKHFQKPPSTFSVNRIHSHNCFPTQNIINDEYHRIKYTKETWSDKKGITKDYHQTVKKPKKKICSKQCVIASMIISLVVGIIITAILLGVLIKSKRQKMPPSGFVALLRWNSTGITIAGLSNSAGNASNQLNEPRDVALVYPDLLYIADYNNHRIQKYQIGSFTGMTVAGEATGSGGLALNQLKHPSCVLVHSSEGIFVSDSGNNRVQYWPYGASMGSTVAGSSIGTPSNTNSTLNEPVGLARDEIFGTLYISDFGNNRVMRYLLNASSGTLTAGSSTFGTAPNQLWKPAGLYFDRLSNSVVIANHNAKNVVRWILGESNWTVLAGSPTGVSGNNATLLNYPQHLTFDPMGNMYVVDKNNHRIQLFMVGQTDGITIAGVTLTSGTNSTLLNTPYAVKLDNQLNLYVADSNNHRIQKFLRY